MVWDLAILSSVAPVDAIPVPLPVAGPASLALAFVSVPVADRVAAVPVGVAFVFVLVAHPTAVVPLAAVFVAVPAADLIPAALFYAAQVLLAVSGSSCFPS